MNEYIIVLSALKNRAAKKQVVEDDACGKDITDGLAFGAHISDVDDLRGHEARSPTPHKQVPILIRESGQAEIANGQIQVILLPEHDVLRLEIPMDDPEFGQVAECPQDAADNLPGLVGPNSGVVLNQEVSTLSISLSCCP